jgi:hypothetical protein
MRNPRSLLQVAVGEDDWTAMATVVHSHTPVVSSASGSIHDEEWNMYISAPNEIDRYRYKAKTRESKKKIQIKRKRNYCMYSTAIASRAGAMTLI